MKNFTNPVPHLIGTTRNLDLCPAHTHTHTQRLRQWINWCIPLIFFVMFIPNFVFGQDQVYFSEVWTQDGGESTIFYKNSSVTDDLGNVYTVGSALNANFDHDIIVQKLDPDGGLIWQQLYGGAANMDDTGADIFVDDSYNVYVTGSSVETPTDDFDLIAMKYRFDGVLQWTTIYDNGGSPTPKDGGIAIIGDNSGSIYVTGSSFGSNTLADYITLRLNASNGSQIWESRYNYANLFDVPSKIELNGTQLFVSGGSQMNANSWELATLVYEPSNGTQIAVKRSQGNSTQGINEVTDLTADMTGNLYLTGLVYNQTTGSDISIYKLDDQLNILWEVQYDGYGLDDRGNGIKVDNLGNVYVAGVVSTSNEGKNYSVLKYNSSGVLQWSREFNGEQDLDDEAMQLAIASNQDIFVTGSARNKANADIQTLGYKPNGELFTQAIFEGQNGLDDFATGISVDLAGNIIVTGKMGEANGNFKNIIGKYSLYLKPFSPVIVNGEPSHNANEVIIRFDRSSVNYAAIDRKGFIAGKLSDFVKPNVITLMNQKLKMNVSRLTTYKIHKSATSNDTLSYTRLGDTIRMLDFWTSLIVEFPNLTNEDVFADSIKSIPSIHHAQLNYIYKLNDVPNDSYYNNYQLGLHPNSTYPNSDINVVGAWEVLKNKGYPIGSNNVKVGVYDQLIDYTHIEFGPTGQLIDSKIKDGKNYHNGLSIEDSYPQNSNTSHGTSIAGLIAANRNNGVGIAGIAGGDFTSPTSGNGVELYSYGIFWLNNSATSAIITEALYEGVSQTNTGYGYGLNIANHSYGSSIGPDQEVFKAMKNGWRNNTVNIAARGNSGHVGNPLEFPGCFVDNIIINVAASGTDGDRKTVGNGDDTQIVYWESSYGKDAVNPAPPCFLDVMAPGVIEMVSTTVNKNHFVITTSDSSSVFLPDCAIPMTQNNNNYSCYNGTSAAAAHISGIASLMYSAHDPINNSYYKNKLTTEDVENILQKTTFKTPNVYSHHDGFGLANAEEAVRQVVLPYSILHKTYTLSNADIEFLGASTNPNINIHLYGAEEALGVNSNEVFKKREKYKAKWVIDYTPTDSEIIDWWKVVARTYGGQLPGGNINSTSFFYQKDPFFIENLIVDTVIDNISGIVEGYYYKFIRADGSFVWAPNDPQLELRYTFALHLKGAADLSVDVEEGIENVIIYPNPSSSDVSIRNIPKSVSQFNISFYDPSGRLVLSKDMTNSLDKINIENLGDGLYYCRIESENYNASTKFIKH